ncbi:hypothetical protein ALC53_02640 [Atta colombica]|uniref:Uncharacterized protein n=1 Tax=Atta colombica TaxID=520822 RepID=A0A195BRM9_9HYME|nr:hypothetical protein ALC53_02640 [Atta colombica]
MIREISRRFAPGISNSVESSTSRVSLTRKVHFNKTIPTTIASVTEIMAVFYAVSRELTTVKSTVLGHEIREFEYFRVEQWDCLVDERELSSPVIHGDERWEWRNDGGSEHHEWNVDGEEKGRGEAFSGGNARALCILRFIVRHSSSNLPA